MAIWLNFVTTISLYRRRKLLCCRSEWINELVSETIESEPTTNSVDFDPIFPILETETEFSSEYFTEMFLSYILGPSVVKYSILSSNRRGKLHAVIDCLFFRTAVSFLLVWSKNLALPKALYECNSRVTVLIVNVTWTSLWHLHRQRWMHFHKIGLVLEHDVWVSEVTLRCKCDKM